MISFLCFFRIIIILSSYKGLGIFNKNKINNFYHYINSFLIILNNLFNDFAKNQ